MKHTFQWILAVVCLLVVGNASVMADGGGEFVLPKGARLRVTNGKILN